MAVEERIGAFIGYKRKRLYLKTHSPQFTQKEFIKTTSKVSLFDCPPGQAVCSRSTLVKIENGFKTKESQLFNFFLSKLDCPHQIMDDSLNKTNKILNHYLNKYSLNKIDDWFNDFKYEIKDMNHELVVFDVYALIVINRWLKGKQCFSKETLLHLLDILKITNEKFQNIIVELICLEIYFNKEHWVYASKVIERFRVLNIKNNFTYWFATVFNFNESSKKIRFPSITRSTRYEKQIERYNWYLNQPMYSYYELKLKRKSLFKHVSKHQRYLKNEPFPFCLSMALLDIDT